jgi:hypothetical protein
MANKECFRFKTASAYLTWVDYGHSGLRFRLGSGQGKSVKSLREALSLFEKIAKNSSSGLDTVDVSQVSLVRQETFVKETVVSRGDELKKTIEEKKALEKTKKRYETFLALQAEFDPSAVPPEIPKDIEEAKEKLSAGILAEKVADSIFGEE